MVSKPRTAARAGTFGNRKFLKTNDFRRTGSVLTSGMIYNRHIRGE